MSARQFILNLSAELLIDSFAGGGGASTGIEMALGRHVDHAINHNAEALGMHRINHPQTIHYCEDVWAVDPQEVCAGRPVGYAHFSPDCTDFSKAKGGKPRRKKIRGLAWVILKWAGLVRPRVISLENVEEFQGWGPVLANGKRCPKRIGKTFRKFVRQLRELGYVVDWRELRASDYGAPTIRKRLFLIARCDGKSIIWPKPTHYATKAEAREHGGKLWRSVAECIDWDLPCPSIFLSKKEARAWRCKRPLVLPTMRRIAKGIGRFVLNTTNPFLVKLSSPFITEHANASNQRNMRANEPLRTVCADVKGGHFAVVSPTLAPTLVNAANTKTTGRGPNTWGVEEPLRTITSAPGFAVVTGSLVQTGYGEREGQEPRAMDAGEPLRTVTAKARMAHVQSTVVHPLTPELEAGARRVAAFLREHGVEIEGEFATVAGGWIIVDIGMRMLTPRELFRAQGFPETYIIDKAWLINPAKSALREVTLTKEQQIRMCGNSVSPPVLAALVKANVPELALPPEPKRRRMISPSITGLPQR